MTTKDKIDSWLRNASKDVRDELEHGSDDDVDEGGDADVSMGSDAGPSNAVMSAEEKARVAKEREARRNASRRASMASQLLSQSLSALPDPSTALGVGKDVKGKARAASSTYPASQASGAPESADAREEEEKKPAAPPAPRAHNTRLATGALSTPPNAYKERSLRSAAATANGSADKGKGKEKAGDGGGEVGDAGGSPAVGALAVLKDCRIFVDVRTDEGDDAGALFVDMLRGMGAKVRCWLVLAFGVEEAGS